MEKKKRDHGLVLGGIALGLFGVEVLNGYLFGLQLSGFPPMAGMCLYFLLPASAYFLIRGLIEHRTKPVMSLARTALLLLLVVCAFAFFGMGIHTFGRASDWGNRAYVSSRIDLDELHAWGVNVLENWEAPPESVREWVELSGTSNRPGIVSALPAGVRKLVSAKDGFLLSDSGDSTKCVLIVFGGGFHHWGVVISSDPDQRGPTMGRDFYKWRDGVWGFQGE